MNTVAQGRTYVADAVKGGSSPTSPAVLAALNRAQGELLANDDLVDLVYQRMKFSVPADRNMIACPSCVECVKGYKTDGIPGVVPKSQFYEFLPSGSGSSDMVSGYKTDMVDWGDHKPTMCEIEAEYAPMSVHAFCSNAADAGKTIFVDGYNENGWRPVNANGEYGELVTLVAGLDGVTVTADYGDRKPSTFKFKQITNVVKPVTKGYVTLMYEYPTEHYWWNLAVYEPKETNPSYHRYKLTLPRDETGVCVTCLVKLRHVPLLQDTDVLIIQNLEALRYQVMCNEHELVSPGQADFYRNKAAGILRRDVAKKTPDQDICLDETWCVGTIVSR